MSLLTYEDYPVGEVIEFGAYHVSEEEIISFAREFDPQAFHTDPVAAKGQMLGGLAASGWHTAAIVMRINYDNFVYKTDSWGGPGIEELKWLKPVRPGDILRVRLTTRGKRVSKSRPEMGFIELFVETLNQQNEVVMTQHWFFMIGLRGAARGGGGQGVRANGGPVATVNNTMGVEVPDHPLYFDDVPVGMRRDLGSFTFTAPDIIRFATAYDPQPFHLSEEGAAKSHFGRLAASGWHTACVWMKLMIAERDRRDAKFTARGMRLAPPGASPGFRNLRWLSPVYAGDTITYDSIISDKRASASRRDWGIVFFKNSGVNQNGVRVFEFDGSTFWARTRSGA